MSRAALALAIGGWVLFFAAIGAFVAAALLSDTRIGHAGGALLAGSAGLFIGHAVLLTVDLYRYAGGRRLR